MCNMLNCLPASSITLQKFPSDMDIYNDTIISATGFPIHKPGHNAVRWLLYVVSFVCGIMYFCGYVNRRGF